MQSIILRIKNTHITIKLLLIILVAFVITSGMIAARLNPGIIPDEKAHFGLSEVFATSWGIPADSPSTYEFGPIGEYPYFYYWINGRVLDLGSTLFPSEGEYAKLVALRFVNVIYSLLTLIFCYLLAKEVINDRWWPLLTVFMLANTLMFTFLSAGVSYDNLANLCSIVSLLFLIKVLNRKPFYLNSLLWLIFACLGTLVKVTIVPLAILEFGIWVFYVIRNFKEIFPRAVFNPGLGILLVVLLVLIGFDESLYGMNQIKYGTVSPVCSQVLAVEQCSQNPVERRNARIQLGEEVPASEILKGTYPDPVNYAFTFWIPTMVERIYGIFGHQTFYPVFVKTIFMLFYFVAAFIIVRNFGKITYGIGGLFVVAVGYTLVLFEFNYSKEFSDGFLNVAIHGRYILPVIGGVYALIAFYMWRIKHCIARKIVYGATALLFLLTGPVLILTNYSAVFHSWFA